MSLTPSRLAQLKRLGCSFVEPVVNKGGRPRKVNFIVAPVATANFKTTPGPKQGVEYKSPYRHMAGRGEQ